MNHPPEIMIEAGRLSRAVHLTAKRIDVDAYLVSGGSQDHTVEVRDGECFCDCFDAHIHGDGCKHSLLIRLLGGDEEVVLALREIIPKTIRATKAYTPPIPAKVP